MEKLDPKYIENIIALTPVQEGILFHYLQDPQSRLYFEQLSLRISGEIDSRHFENAWNTVTEANEMLRTVFRWEKLEKPSQIILKERRCKIRFHDLSDMDKDRGKAALEKIKIEERNEGFDFSQVPFRVILCKLNEKEYEMVIGNHHILYDGWSTGVILREFFQVYHELRHNGRPLKIPTKSSFKEFIGWIQSLDKNKQEKFWRDYLSGFETSTELPIKRGTKETTRAEDYWIALGKGLTDKLDAFVKRSRVTQAAVFYSAWGILLQRYCNSEDIIFGTTVSGRSAGIKRIEDMVGLFINTIPLRIQTGPSEKIIDVVFRIDGVLREREEFESTSPAEIGNYSPIVTGGSLFDTIVAIENYPLDNRLLPQGEGDLLSIQSYSMVESTHYDLSIGIMPFNNIEINFNYKQDCFDQDTVANLAGHFKGIIQNIIESPEAAVSQLEMLSSEEKSRILFDFNNTAAEYPTNKTIQQLFEEQASKTPDHVGLVGDVRHVGPVGPVCLSYNELNDQSDRLAGLLIEKGVLPDSIVGITVERSVEIIIGILGILKSGGAYLPIDPNYPRERIDYMLKDSNARALLRMEECQKEIIVNCKLKSAPQAPFHHSSFIIHHSNQLAYIIYTSGSTGRPKGVLVEHASVVNLAFSRVEQFAVDTRDRILQFSSISFDASVEQVFIAFFSGAVLVLIDENTLLDAEKFSAFLFNRCITHLDSVPSFLNNIDLEHIPGLKRIISGGEVCSISLARRLSGYCDFYNQYGPTETTVTAVALKFSEQDEIRSNVPIGKPIANTVVYVLDRFLRPAPIGAPGELFIGGRGVARGYLNNPGLTAERFYRSYGSYRTYATYKTYIFYKTGDLARWLDRGAIEFLGRIDQQVKIRGFRIELGEIENRLLKHEWIKEVVALAKEDAGGDKYLAVYFVSDQEIPGTELKEYLAKDLPDYMIPSCLIRLERIPLTPTGKVDRNALPEPGITLEENPVMPGSENEMKLAGIWSAVLGVDPNKISIDANFFRLGGHSLKITRLASLINRELGLTISLTELFKRPTIRLQARYLREMEQQKQKVELIPIRQAPIQEYYDLSYAQRRLWIICQFEEDSIAYNEVGGLTIKGKFNPIAFEQAIHTLAQRHESLRTVFVIIDGEPKQKILPQVELKLRQEDLRDVKGDSQKNAAAEIIKNTANKAFNLEKGPLAVFKLLHLEDEKYFLLVNIHHIINDGWSVGIIKKELNTLYDFFNRNLSSAEKIPLPAVTFQYKDYTLWHNRLITAGYFDRFKDYWLEKFKDKPTGIELPLDHPRGAAQTFNGGRVYYSIEESETARLRDFANEENSTPFMKLMTLLSILLHKYSGEKDIIVGSPIAGRKQPELHHIIGFLVNTLVYRVRVDPGESFPELLAKVKEEILACYENQDYPFDILVESLGLARDMSRSPLFNVLAAYGDMDSAGEDIHFDWADVEFNDQVEGFNPSVFDLVFFFNEKGNHLDCEIMYNSDLFERNTIRRMAANFLTLVKNVLGKSEKAIFELEYIEKEEYETIVHRFNSHKEDFLPVTIQELVEKQVEKSLDGVAAVSPEGWAITYHEINQRANRLAHYLRRNYGMGPGKIAGICIERSIEMIIAVLGVIKSGAAYLSFDPNYPKDRVKHMIDDSRAGLAIIDQSRPDLFDMNEEKGQAPLDIHQHWSAIGRESIENPKIQNEPGDAVYVIYTSGSTGTPNGAMLSHALLSNLIQWQIKDTVIDCSLRCLQFTSINFCVSFQEIFTTLSSGGEVHLIGDIERQDIEYLMAFLARRKIGNLYLPFSYLNFLFNLSGEAASDNYLQHIITAGEQLKITGGLKQFLENNPDVKLHNHYGSSEMHVVTAYTLDNKTAAVMPVPPAGKPIANTRIYILDENEKAVPIGVWGELFVDGGSEVLGYIHNTILTDKKLLWHSAFSPLSGHRLYRSGDVGRWLEDGNIELKGRKDFQVKIRGFRVEPSEIESKILALDKVKDCVVVVKENAAAEKILTAYVVGHDLDVMEIKRHLGSYLPRYMIPKFMVLESLPLMPNGKVDREKLPELPVESENIKPMAARPVRPAPFLTPLRGQIRDFDSLPLPDRSLVNYDKYGKNIGLAMVRHTIALQASRGCPYNCLYCHKIWPKKHVFRSAENIFREVELYYNMGVRRFVFVDDIFNLDVRNSTRFFEMVIKNKLDAHFFFPNGLRSDILTNDYIDLMAAGGTRGMGMALESASPRIQRLLKKNLDLDKLRENAEYLCNKHPQILLELFLMHGFPTETEEEAIQTLEFLKALHWIDFPYLHILKIFPNTDMAAMAMENGVTAEAITRSAGLAFHELPETLPFPKSFTLKRQAEFLGDYFLLKERLLTRLPYQAQVLTPVELVEKYNSYLPVEIKTIDDILEFAGIEPGLLAMPDEKEIMRDEKVRAIDLDANIRKHFKQTEPQTNALRILLLDLSQYFSGGKKILYDGVEPPLGLMYLLTYLNRELGARVKGKIAKSRVDFDSYDELKQMLEEFRPQVIGIRTLTYYSRFFHETVGNIRQCGYTGPVIAGGPYATSDYTTILKDPHVDVVVLSEGELTFTELITGIIANRGEWPGDAKLNEIAGLAYVPGNRAATAGKYQGVFQPNEWTEGPLPGLQMAELKKEVSLENEIEAKLAGIWSEILGVEKGVIGREDNFFELGGHSLKATTMMTKIHKEFHVRVKLIDIFKAPNIRDIALLVKKSGAGSFEEIGKLPEKAFYEMSFAQKRLWYINQNNLMDTAYNMPVKSTLYEPVDEQVTREVLTQLMLRHESLRTVFKATPEGPVQVIESPDVMPPKLNFTVLDLTPLSQADKENQRMGLFKEESSYIFNLEKGPLFRARLVKCSEAEYDLILNIHHIISDGWSLEILKKEFFQLYESYKKGLTCDLEPLKIQYKDYAAWQNKLLDDVEKMAKAKEFWKNYLADYLALALPYDFPIESLRTRKTSAYCFFIEAELLKRLHRLAAEQKVSLFIILLAAFHILLNYITYRENISIAVPAAARQHSSLQNIIGLFVNTLILQSRVNAKETFTDFLKRFQADTFDVLEYQSYPLEIIFAELKLKYPEIQAFFNMQNIGTTPQEYLENFSGHHIEETHETKFPIHCYLTEYKNGILIECNYYRELFKPASIEKFMRVYTRILDNTVSSPTKKIKELPKKTMQTFALAKE